MNKKEQIIKTYITKQYPHVIGTHHYEELRTNAIFNLIEIFKEEFAFTRNVITEKTSNYKYYR